MDQETLNLLDIFSKKRVLVTGDTGFKGSWLCQVLKLFNADIVGYALPPESKYDHFNLINLDQMPLFSCSDFTLDKFETI